MNKENYWTGRGAVQWLFPVLPRILFFSIIQTAILWHDLTSCLCTAAPSPRFFFGWRVVAVHGLIKPVCEYISALPDKVKFYRQLAPIWLDMFLLVSLFLPGTFSFHPRLQATFDESARCLWGILQSSQERRFQTKENLFSKHALLVKGTKWLLSPWVINPDTYPVNIWLWFKTLYKRVKPPRSTNKNITASSVWVLRNCPPIPP